jgi:hypothetical protein
MPLVWHFLLAFRYHTSQSTCFCVTHRGRMLQDIPYHDLGEMQSSTFKLLMDTDG